MPYLQVMSLQLIISSIFSTSRKFPFQDRQLQWIDSDFSVWGRITIFHLLQKYRRSSQISDSQQENMFWIKHNFTPQSRRVCNFRCLNFDIFLVPFLCGGFPCSFLSFPLPVPGIRCIVGNRMMKNTPSFKRHCVGIFYKLQKGCLRRFTKQL